VFVESLGGGLPAERLAGPDVQRRSYGFNLITAPSGQVGSLGEVLAQEPIGVFVRPTLPRAVWSAK
jgi:hypothetical protein